MFWHDAPKEEDEERETSFVCWLCSCDCYVEKFVRQFRGKSPRPTTSEAAETTTNTNTFSFQMLVPSLAARARQSEHE